MCDAYGSAEGYRQGKGSVESSVAVTDEVDVAYDGDIDITGEEVVVGDIAAHAVVGGFGEDSAE